MNRISHLKSGSAVESIGNASESSWSGLLLAIALIAVPVVILQTLIAVPHLPQEIWSYLTSTLPSLAHTLFKHTSSQGIPCPAGRLNLRAVRVWAQFFAACYLQV